MTPNDVRRSMTEALVADLIGPGDDSPLADETLSQSPSRWYLTGFLVPTDAPDTQKYDENQDEDLEKSPEAGGDDSGSADSAPARRALFPSSMGMSLLVPPKLKELTVTISWGDYDPVYEAVAEDQPKPSEPPSPKAWKRTARRETVKVALSDSQGPREQKIEGSGDLYLATAIRPIRDIPAFEQVSQKNARSVSVFVVNRRKSSPDELRDRGYVFQVQLKVATDVPLVARPNLRGLESEDWDDRVADLQYQDACEYAVGHGIATHAAIDPDDHCRTVTTCWIPSASVERVAPSEIPDVVLGMAELADTEDAIGLSSKLLPLVSHYRAWIDGHRAAPACKHKKREVTRGELLKNAEVAARRIEDGIALLSDPLALEAFRTMNRVMASQAKQRDRAIGKRPEKDWREPAWRPFQLAFVLMNLRGIVEPTHSDREVVDLLFFPTGGGKTEAYLGLAAFALVLRRLKTPGIGSAGLCVLMRYTLRLLTLDQLSRAATLICALELERVGRIDRLGEWPFEIGLWVGRTATPNVMGKKGDGKKDSARDRTLLYRNNEHEASPVPLEDCPWCGTKLDNKSFRLSPNIDNPSDLLITCGNRDCAFSGDSPLPVVAVDEPIYRRLPCFLIATVDKFAAMPWTGEVGGFFGRVDRHDRHGFYGPCDPAAGQPLPHQLAPPDLIIQDELHLISGPMGTMVGLYEAALDALCTREVAGKRVRPKIVASTATVRRADKQIRALFDRSGVDIFPPPGPDRRDSFFARTHTAAESDPRQYVGVAAQGRSAKVILLRTYLALMGAAQKCYSRAGGKGADNPADAYMTLVGYFNSLRELGGSRRIVEDEVSTRLEGYGNRVRVGQTDGLFRNRSIQYDVVELTSRVSTDKVADAKRRLAVPFGEKDFVDVAIATNMISVGLDITRLGLMVVLGQPKTSAEYIQASSRVGRDVRKPGLVVTILNVHRPRDRSHYERFANYHETFYRSVEATSVTPFSPRAMDRGLAAAVVALVRQGLGAMTAPRAALAVADHRAELDRMVESLVGRADRVLRDAADGENARGRVRVRVADLLDEWSKIAHEYNDQGVGLQYQSETGAAQPLLHAFLDPALRVKPARHRKFRANRSMRDVEPSVNLWLRTLDGAEVKEAE